MVDTYCRLNQIIKEAIDSKKKIAVFPFGRVGLQAKHIIEERYGQTALYIDNEICKYNKKVISLEEFSKMNTEEYIVMICVIDSNLDTMLEELLREHINCEVLNYLRKPYVEYIDAEYDYFTKIKKLCWVKKEINREIIRIGKNNDGGYALLNNLESIEIAYGFGISGDVSFEKKLAEYGIKVYCYDHTIDRLPDNSKGLIFRKNGIAANDDVDNHMLSFPTILKDNNHNDRENMLLKMDVEGCEWEVLDSIDSTVLKKFNQIVIEIHDILETSHELVLRVLDKLTTTHQVIWVHGNNNSKVIKAKDILISDVLEMCLVRKDSYNFEDTDFSIPQIYDMPNVENIHEVELGTWS